MAWVTLDEADDDPHAFWCAVATALMPDLDAPAVEALRRVAAGAVEADDLPRVMAAALRLGAGSDRPRPRQPARDPLARGAQRADTARRSGHRRTWRCS